MAGALAAHRGDEGVASWRCFTLVRPRSATWTLPSHMPPRPAPTRFDESLHDGLVAARRRTAVPWSRRSPRMRTRCAGVQGPIGWVLLVPVLRSAIPLGAKRPAVWLALLLLLQFVIGGADPMPVPQIYAAPIPALLFLLTLSWAWLQAVRLACCNSVVYALGYPGVSMSACSGLSSAVDRVMHGLIWRRRWKGKLARLVPVVVPAASAGVLIAACGLRPFDRAAKVPRSDCCGAFGAAPRRRCHHLGKTLDHRPDGDGPSRCRAGIEQPQRPPTRCVPAEDAAVRVPIAKRWRCERADFAPVHWSPSIAESRNPRLDPPPYPWVKPGQSRGVGERQPVILWGLVALFGHSTVRQHSEGRS